MLQINVRQKSAIIMILMQIPIQTINVGLTGFSFTSEKDEHKGPLSTGAEYTGIILAVLTLFTMACDLADRCLVGRKNEIKDNDHSRLREIIVQGYKTPAQITSDVWVTSREAGSCESLLSIDNKKIERQDSLLSLIYKMRNLKL